MRTEALVFMGVVALFGLYWTYRTFAANKADKAWRAVAKVFGFYFRDHPIRLMEGEREGLHLKVETVTSTGHEGFDGHATYYRVSYPALNLGLYISHKDKREEAPAARDIEIGHKPFDDILFVTGNDPDAIREYLTPARRMRIERLFSSVGGSCIIEDAKIVHEHDAVDNEAKVVLSKVFSLLCTAKALVGEEGEDRARDEAAASREEERELHQLLRRLTQEKSFGGR